MHMGDATVKEFARGDSSPEYGQENEILKQNEELINDRNHKECYFRKERFGEFQC